MSFAFFPLYTGDYLRDTQHLSMSEHGCYLKLLMFCWDQKGPAPLDERKLCGIVNARSGDEIEALRRVMTEFFVRMDDGWYNRRLQHEVERSEAISHARSEAGKKGYQAKAKQLLSKRLASASTPTPTPTPIKEKDKDGADAPDVWEFGIDLLTREGGLGKGTARSYLGALCKSWPESTVLDALMAAAGKADPKAYARKWLDDKPRKGAARKSAADEALAMLEARDAAK